MALREYQTRLIAQVYEAWDNGYKAPCLVLPCGGGKSIITAEIAKRHTDRGQYVLFLVHRRELVEQIEGTFAGWGVNMLLCQVGMVQTVSRHLRTTNIPNLIITDENHHSLATTYKKIYDYFSDVRRLGVTATPWRLNGKGLKDVNDILIEGVTTKWLIDNHFLSPYKLYSRNMNMPKFHIRNGDYEMSEVVNYFNQNSSQIFGDTIAEYRRLADNTQAVCYLPSIEISKDIARNFTLKGIKAEHIDGETPKGERTAIIERFRTGETRILCNVDIISEGFDVPDCECAIILDQVGNYATHGMPDDTREWSLEDRPKREPKEKLPQFKKCKRCGAEVPISTKICDCGYVFVRDKEYISTDEKLVEIKPTMQPSECKNMAELYKLAELKGYKRGWAYYKGKELGLLGKRAEITEEDIIQSVKGTKHACRGWKFDDDVSERN